MAQLSSYLPLFNMKAEGIPTAFEVIYFENGKAKVVEKFGDTTSGYAEEVEIFYQKKLIGKLLASGLSELGLKNYADHFSPLLRAGELEYNLKVLEWVNKARELVPEICQWTGVYYKTSFLNGEDSTDLVLGPYIGAATEHDRISLSRGFCGMALREERTVNVADVNADDSHIACSLSTKSELVIPLKNKQGEMIAELDIDSDKLNAFSPKIQKEFEAFATTFSAI